MRRRWRYRSGDKKELRGCVDVIEEDVYFVYEFIEWYIGEE